MLPVASGPFEGEPFPPPPRQPRQRRAPQCDPWAAAIGNAAMPGLGYLFLRRPMVAMVAIVATVGLLVAVASAGQPGWGWRAAALCWWLATALHGWFWAGGRLPRRHPADPATPPPDSATPQMALDPPPVVVAEPAPLPAAARRQRQVAVVAGLVVFSLFVGVAVEARVIERSATSAHRAGECEQSIATLDRVVARHRLVDPLVTRRADDQVAACELLLAAHLATQYGAARAAGIVGDYLDHGAGRWSGAAELRVDLLLEAAAADLAAATSGPPGELQSGLVHLAAVLDEAPHRAGEVETILAGYLEQLATMEDRCHALLHTNQLQRRPLRGDQLDQVVEALPAVAPPIIAGCGDQHLQRNPSRALETYETLRERYPDHPLATEVLPAMETAEGLIERDHVQDLLYGWPDRPADSLQYCEEPAPYRGAPAHPGGGPHRVVMAGTPSAASALPDAWRATDYTDAALVACVFPSSRGAVFDVCFYEGGIVAGLHTRVNELMVFSLRTAELLHEATVESRGECPPQIYHREGDPPPQLLPATTDHGPMLAALRPWVGA